MPESSSAGDLPVKIAFTNTSRCDPSPPTDRLSDDEVRRIAESFLESRESGIVMWKEISGERAARQEVRQFVESFLESRKNAKAKWEQIWGPPGGNGRATDENSADSGLTAQPDDSTPPGSQNIPDGSIARSSRPSIPTAENIFPLGDKPPDSYLEFVADRLSPEGQEKFVLIQLRTAMAAIEDRLNSNSTAPPTRSSTVRQSLGQSLKSLFEREAEMINLKGEALSKSDATRSHPETRQGDSVAYPSSLPPVPARHKRHVTGKRR
jgi:hypothetical protein